MRVLLILSLLPALLFSQSYFEASGQTAAFTLAVGSTAGWNAGGTGNQAHAAINIQPSLAVYPNPSRGSVCLQVKGSGEGAMVAIYNVAGKKIQTLDFTKRSAATVSAGLSNGIYFARLRVKGRTEQTTRFLVVR